jgi:hypothetical protein
MDNNTQDLIRESARKACLNQLQDVMIPVIYEGLYVLWLKAKEQEEAKQIGSSYIAFQNNLSMIPKWNNIIIMKRHEMCVQKCPWIDKLIEKTFLLQAQLLASVAGNKTKIAVKVPESTHMLHTCYINASKRFWYLPRLFEDRVGKQVSIQEQQQNLQKVFDIIKETIETTVLELLPMKTILDEASQMEVPIHMPSMPVIPPMLPTPAPPPNQNMLHMSAMPPPLMQPMQPMPAPPPNQNMLHMSAMPPQTPIVKMPDFVPEKIIDVPKEKSQEQRQEPEKEELRLPVLFQRDPSQASIFKDVKISPEVEDILKNGRPLKNKEMEIIDGTSIPYSKPLNG